MSGTTLARLPIAYHVFNRPLAYHATLALQDKIVEARLAARKADPTSELARRDIVLLLGELIAIITTASRSRKL